VGGARDCGEGPCDFARRRGRVSGQADVASGCVRFLVYTFRTGDMRRWEPTRCAARSGRSTTLYLSFNGRGRGPDRPPPLQTTRKSSRRTRIAANQTGTLTITDTERQYHRTYDVGRRWSKNSRHARRGDLNTHCPDPPNDPLTVSTHLHRPRGGSPRASHASTTFKVQHGYRGGQSGTQPTSPTGERLPRTTFRRTIPSNPSPHSGESSRQTVHDHTSAGGTMFRAATI